jgi:hypothetical protein
VEILAADPAADVASHVAILARRLSASEFSRRQQAETELLSLGPDVLPALHTALGSADLEAHYRLERIISSLERAQREHALTAFRAGELPADPQLLAGWAAFAQLVGDQQEARELFAEMARIEPWLVTGLSGPVDQLRHEFERRCADVNLRRIQQQDSQRSIATVAALLLAASQPDCHPSTTAVACITACIQEGQFLEMMRQPDRPEPLERLVAVWISDPASSSALQRLQLAARFELIEGVDVALQIIRQRLPGPQLQHAVLYLAKAGNASHLYELELLLADSTDLQTQRQKSVTTFSSRVQDVALAALLHMTGQDPRTYGFTDLREHPQYLYAPGTIGFNTEEERSSALGQWKRWSAGNLKAVQPFVEQAALGYSA